MEIWDRKLLYAKPSYGKTNILKHPGVNAIFFDSVPWQGKPVKVFAWCGVPKLKSGRKAPGIVLVHGGLGTAYAGWVKLWNSRGYAAIAMDTCGAVPDGGRKQPSSKDWPRHEHSGPAGWGNFDQSGLPLKEQWPYHAVAAVILGHSLLRSFEGVAPDKIGITGVSWGGMLACITAGIDDRLAFAAPVYGCGFLGNDSSCFAPRDPLHSRWLELWDPSIYLKDAAMPFLWLNGTNDIHFPMESLQESSRLTRGEKRLCIRVRMGHSHGEVSEKPPEILDFAEATLNGGELPPAFTDIEIRNGKASVSYSGARKIVKAELNFTRASGFWTDRFWNTAPAELDAAGRSVGPDGPAKRRSNAHCFAAAGAVQCGFCIPGMVISAKALLDQNLPPPVRTSRRPSAATSAAAPATRRSRTRS